MGQMETRGGVWRLAAEPAFLMRTELPDEDDDDDARATVLAAPKCLETRVAVMRRWC